MWLLRCSNCLPSGGSDCMLSSFATGSIRTIEPEFVLSLFTRWDPKGKLTPEGPIPSMFDAESEPDVAPFIEWRLFPLSTRQELYLLFWTSNCWLESTCLLLVKARLWRREPAWLVSEDRSGLTWGLAKLLGCCWAFELQLLVLL